jgi:hypothetical protein
MTKPYKAIPDRNRRHTWTVVEVATGRIILQDHPGYYAKEVAHDCNTDPRSCWLRWA